jgi:basic membrane protein A
LLPTAVLATACGTHAAGGTPPATKPASTPLALAPLPPARRFSAALVTDVGGLHDRSFNQLAWKALVEARRRYRITILNAESRREVDYEPNLRRFAQHYAGLIVAVGFSMAAAVYQAAEEFPQQRFAIVDAWPVDANGRPVSLPNVEDILFDEQDSGYLAGVVAGQMEKSRAGRAAHNTIGYLGGTSIPGVQHYLAGYIAGARTVDPTLRVVGQFAGTFVDARLGRQIATRQIAHGADILFQVAGLTGSGYLEAARQKGAYGIGADIDESYLGPYILTSALKRVDVAVGSTIASILRGHFRAGLQRFGSAVGATGIAAPSRVVPSRIAAVMRKYERELRDGTVVPPSSIPAR